MIYGSIFHHAIFRICFLVLTQSLCSHGQHKSTAQELVFVEGGEFKMGAIERSFFTKQQRPLHRVKVKSFYINRTEITNADFCTYLNSVKRKLKIERKDIASQDGVALRLGKDIICDVKVRDSQKFRCGIKILMNKERISGFKVLPGQQELPVTFVSWYGAQAYCKWRYDKGNLPSESQWEYAAKGGQNFNEHSKHYSGSDTLDKVGWYWDNADFQVQLVAQKRANSLGIFDMSGNLWEWVLDHWHDNYDGAPTNGKAWIDKRSKKDQNRVLRGGSWLYHESRAKVTHRWSDVPDDRHSYKGFRCICDKK